MNIVIIGAGNIGSYIARLLSREKHNVILVDKNAKRLQEASWVMDVAIKEGSGTDWQVLDNLLDLSPDLFVSLTDDDHANLVGCAIAKNLGYPRTIARIKDNHFLNRVRLDLGRIFDVDYFIGPELLVANEIFKNMISPGSLRVESFAHGAVQLRTIVIPQTWRRSEETLADLKLPPGIMVGLISREAKTDVPGGSNREIIFPHGYDRILPGDEVTLIGETDDIANIHQYFGSPYEPIHSVVIMGGSQTAYNLAKILEQRNINVRIIEKNYERCCWLSEQLKHCTVINHDGTDLDFLLEEKVSQADVFVCCTRYDELNIMSSLLAREAGCENAIIQLSNTGYIPIVTRLGINHTASPRVIAANRLLALAFSGTVTSVVSLYENQAEILEINVSMRSKIAGIPISELGPLLPKDFLIACIQNRGRIMIAKGDRIISPGDTVIVVSHPRHINELEKIF
jgi:trk system potassium uptake protein TrkA